MVDLVKRRSMLKQGELEYLLFKKVINSFTTVITVSTDRATVVESTVLKQFPQTSTTNISGVAYVTVFLLKAINRRRGFREPV